MGEIGLYIKKGGYLPYHLGIKSYHHLIWFKIATSIALESQISLSKPPAARKLILHNPNGSLFSKPSSLYHDSSKRTYTRLLVLRPTAINLAGIGSRGLEGRDRDRTGGSR